MENHVSTEYKCAPFLLDDFAPGRYNGRNQFKGGFPKMTFDYTTLPERHGWDAIAVDLPDGSGFPVRMPTPPKGDFSLIPMWVADMNFLTAPTIVEAIQKRAAHPAYGYYQIRDEYYDSILRWQAAVHGLTDITAEMIGYENGVLGCVASALQAFSSPGEGVLVHSPTYIGFTHIMDDNGRRPVLSPLKQDEAGVWRMDLEDMEEKICREHIHLAILCSPHNPMGRVWSRKELEEVMELFRRYDVIVISDEIWSDLTLDDNVHVPTLSVSEDAAQRTIGIYAPSKTFNLAGLIGSYHIIPNRYLRDRVVRQAACSGYNSMNVLSQHALIGAYSETGEAWMRGLREVLSQNVADACAFFGGIDGITFPRPEGTYMLYLDLTGWCRDHGIDLETVLESGWDVGVAWQDGRPFHGPCHIRLNLALPNAVVNEALGRLGKYVFKNC